MSSGQKAMPESTTKFADPNRVVGMPVLHHSVSGKSTGAVSKWYECKRQWGPYLEAKYGRAGRVIRDGKFPEVPEIPEPS